MILSKKIKPLILVGSGGSGRAALEYHLIREFPHKFQRAISHTTRKPKEKEKQNEDFYFTDDKFILDNMNKFITLTKSSNGYYYGLVGEEITRVIGAHKIPILKMTLESYKGNVSHGNIEIKETETPIVEQIAQSLFGVSFFTLDKNIECNALYITVPNFKEMKKVLEMSPLDDQQRKLKVEMAAKEEEEARKIFAPKNIIESSTDMDETIKNLESKLFQLY